MTCEDCGSKVYNGHCTWCHEETYIAEQNYSNDEPITFSKPFLEKVDAQAIEAKEIIEKQNEQRHNEEEAEF